MYVAMYPIAYKFGLSEFFGKIILYEIETGPKLSCEIYMP